MKVAVGVACCLLACSYGEHGRAGVTLVRHTTFVPASPTEGAASAVPSAAAAAPSDGANWDSVKLEDEATAPRCTNAGWRARSRTPSWCTVACPSSTSAARFAPRIAVRSRQVASRKCSNPASTPSSMERDPSACVYRASSLHPASSSSDKSCLARREASCAR